MNFNIPHSLTVLVSAALMILAAPATVAHAQSAPPATAPAPGAVFMTVTGDEVFVRSGADFGYYGMGYVHSGDVVRVVGERGGFSRVQLVGPAFSGFYGYIKYSKAQTGRFRVSDDGRSGTTLGRMDVIAPNAQKSYHPEDSFKTLVRLEPDQTLNIFETLQTEKEHVHKVALPPTAEGWVGTNYLRPATEEEISAWESAVAAAQRAARDMPPATDEPPVTASKQETKPETTPALAREETTIDPVEPPSEPASTTTDAPATSAPATTTEEIAADTKSTAEETSASAPTAEDTRTSDQKLADDIAKLTIGDLEAAYKALAKQPTETAEIGPLRDQYLAFAERHADDEGLSRYALARADQLRVWGEVQERVAKLADVRARGKLSARDAENIRRAMDARASYDAVGKLDVSMIYDGERLPKLLRLQDLSTGRTLAYLQTDDERFNLITMLGEIVGIVGETTYDEGLGLTLISPRRIDLLAPQG